MWTEELVPGRSYSHHPASWPETDTGVLVDLWCEDSKDHDSRGRTQNLQFCDVISKKLAEEGIYQKGLQCQEKIKSLKNGGSRRRNVVVPNFPRMCQRWASSEAERLRARVWELNSSWAIRYSVRNPTDSSRMSHGWRYYSTCQGTRIWL